MADKTASLSIEFKRIKIRIALKRALDIIWAAFLKVAFKL